ncbi:MAG: elongation factor Ts [Xanthomonadaceae bacterium]|nr:elongation factor Ts [Rhodospirillaceae bacterium]NIA18150.1 elongation factor Ts [Xanthomonadaceae bacterium]
MENIKKLREITGAGIVDCKKALDEAKQDIDKAVEIIRKKGGAKAAKKIGRETNEGLIDIVISDDNKKCSIVKILCETDFVARNHGFKNFVKDVARAGLDNSSKEYFNSKKDEMVLKIGENLIFGKGELLAGEYIASYIHSNNKVGSVVVFNKKMDESLATDIAMQIVAMSPDYIAPEDVPTKEIEKEKEIYREQLKKEGKPEQIIDKILIGKINKYFSEICLLKQIFIKNDKKSIEQIIKETDQELKIIKFVRYSL